MVNARGEAVSLEFMNVDSFTQYEMAVLSNVVTESREPLMNMRISLLLYSLLHPVPLRVNGNTWKTLQHLGCISCLLFSTNFWFGDYVICRDEIGNVYFDEK